MTVKELIALLAEMPPELELWEYNYYGAGVKAAHFHPQVETLCLHKGQGNPRYLRQLSVKDVAKWLPDRQVVAL